jgi:uncharacterized protein YqeY
LGVLRDRIAADVKAAMKARDQLRLDTLRSALSGFIYKRAETGQDLTDSEELDVVRRQVKQRNDAIAEFQKAGRTDLADKETREREILAVYLPQQKSPDEIRAIVKAAIGGLSPENLNQGAVMKAVMPTLKGLADGNVVRDIVTRELQET